MLSPFNVFNGFYKVTQRYAQFDFNTVLEIKFQRFPEIQIELDLLKYI
jgi:hypothetical protein